jgi:uncharacterized protein (DUF1501 family)
MDTLSRRLFLKLTATASVVGGAQVLSLDEIASAAITRPLPENTPILVVLTLYGGNDGLNTVIPYKDGLYYSLRPDISYPQEKVLPLSDGLGLNPSLVGIKSLWDKKKVAIFRGVGYPNPSQSHFSSMAIWQSGQNNYQLRSGWLGRWVDTQKFDPLLAINLGSVLPPLLVGEKRSGSVLPLGGYIKPVGSLVRDCSRLSLASPTDSPLAAQAASSLRDLLTVSAELSPILSSPTPAPLELPTINGGNAGGDNQLSQQLDLVSKLINAGAPTRVWTTSLGGFDTHANEADAQAALLSNVDKSITRFFSQLSQSTRGKDVTLLIYSEFGRRVVANASAGTDHGTSGPVFVIGDNIKGGFYGDQPSLKSLVKDNLAVTTDFRDIYASLIEGILKTPATAILGGWKGRVKSLLYKQ